MPEREIKPGISLAGAIDLEGLKHQVKAEPGQAGGAPAAGGYVIDVTQNNFQAVAQASATYPIVIFMWVPTDNRLFDMARELGDAVNGMDGKLQLARIDVSREPEITTQVLPQLVQVAAQAGVTGTAPYITPQNADDEEDTQKEPAVPPEHAEAHRLAQEGDYAGAADAYEQVLEREPDDELAKRGRAKALLLARSANADVREAREKAAANPDDLDAQLAVADVDMIGGQIQDAFDRLLDYLAAHPDAVEPIRERMLEYFLIPEATDERLARARRRLATLMY